MRTLLVDHAAALRARSTPAREPQAFAAHYQGRPLRFILTGGEASDYTAAEPLMDIPVATSKALLADKGYDGDHFRASLLIRGILPIIPPRSIARRPITLATATRTAIGSSACSAS